MTFVFNKFADRTIVINKIYCAEMGMHWSKTTAISNIISYFAINVQMTNDISSLHKIAMCKWTWITYIYKVKYIIYNCTICQFYCSPSDDVVRRCKDTHTHFHTHIHARRQRSRMRNSDDDIVIVYILFRANLRLANK